MLATTTRRRPSKASAAVPIGWLAALWGWIFWSCAGDWQSDDAQFGWLVPPLAAYFLFRRLETYGSHETSWTWKSCFLLCLLAAAIGPLELLRLSPLTWRLTLWSMFAVVAAITLLASAHLLPRNGWRTLLFPILFSALALPWPTALEAAITGNLATALAAAVAETMRWTGVPAIAAGKTVSLGDCVIGIERACSGLHSVQSALILSLGIGELRQLRLGARFALLACGIVLALIENFTRLLALCGIGSRSGSLGVERWHDLAGWTGSAALVLGIFLASRMFARAPFAPGKITNVPQTPISPAFAPIRIAAAIGVCAFLFAHGWYDLWPPSQGDPQPRLGVANRSAVGIEAPPHVLAELHPASGGYFSGTIPGCGPSQAYHFFWPPSRGNVVQLFHRPDVCMPGTGWIAIGAPREWTLETQGQPLRWWDFVFERDGIRAHMLWTSLIAGENFGMTFNAKASPQSLFLAEAVRRRLSRPSYEVAGILLSTRDGGCDFATAQRAVNTFFGSDSTGGFSPAPSAE